MQYIQLYAQSQGSTGSTDFVELDLYKEDPIKMNKSVQSLTDPGIATSAYSQTFRLPATDVNIRYFKAVFNVNVEDYDPTLKANAYINIDGEYYTGGSIRLVKTFTNGRRSINEFEIQFLGETRTFSGVVGGKFLADLNFSDLAHDLTYDNIVLSWNAAEPTAQKLLNGDVLYPLAEWGYTYNSASVPIESTLSVYDSPTGNFRKGFTNSGNPLALNQFFPAIKVKRIWDKIFEDAGFTYESEFISNENFDFFNRLYYMGTPEASSTYIPLVNTVVFRNTFGPRVAIDLAVGWNRLRFATSPAILDTYNGYSPFFGTYTARFNSTNLVFEVDHGLSYRTSTSASANYTIRLRRFRNGVNTTVAQTTFSLIGANSGLYNDVRTRTAVFTASNVLVNDIYFVEILFSATVTSAYINGNSFQISMLPVSNPSILFPKDQYTQIEFLRSLTKKFNLIWEPDPNNPTKFIIEPWNDWVARGTQRDWTNILENAQDLDIEPLFYTQPRTTIFKDSSEADLYNFSYEQETKQVFGQLNLESNIEVISGEGRIETMFAPVPLAPIGNSATFLVPHFAKDTETQRQPIQLKPRLVFYNGLVNNPAAVPTWYMRNTAGSSIAQSKYPLISQFNSYPFDELSFDLNWTNSKQFWNAGANQGISGQTSNTAFSNFWQNWYEATYSKFSRRMEATFVLDTEEIKNLRFNDLIFIKDSWWLPVKYEDFGLGEKQKVKVELVKYWPPIGINIGSTGPSAGPILFAQPNICFGNSICDACCCTGLNLTVWSDNRNLSQSAFIFATASGILPAQGYYSDGTNYYEVSQNGTILSIGSCASCDCTPVVPETLDVISLCYADSPCDAFCCVGATGDFYVANNAQLEGNPEIFGSGSGNPATPNKWYSDGSAIYLVGDNGFTIVQEADTSLCDCNQLEYFGFFGFGTGITGACCIEGVTGANGVNSVWYDDTPFTDADVFYFDSSGELPVGPTSSVYISDGENWVEVTGGTAVSTGDCSGITCDNRTLDLSVTLVHESGTSVDLTATGYLSFDLSNFYFAAQNTSSGGPFTDSYTDNYAPGNQFYYTAEVTDLGTLTASVLENGDIVYTETLSLGIGEIYTTPTFTINSNPWEVIFTWEP